MREREREGERKKRAKDGENGSARKNGDGGIAREMERAQSGLLLRACCFVMLLLLFW